MADRRRRGVDWYVADESGGLYQSINDSVMLAVLMDIRDELQQINSTLGCANFTSIPRILRRISGNTAKPRKTKGE